MARFVVYASPDEQGFLLDVQSDLLSTLASRVVVPLLPVDAAPIAAGRLNPIIDVNGVRCSMVTQYLASVPAKLLKSPVLDVQSRRDDITAALDLLFQGF